jgi:hypothetical protein
MVHIAWEVNMVVNLKKYIFIHYLSYSLFTLFTVLTHSPFTRFTDSPLTGE